MFYRVQKLLLVLLIFSQIDFVVGSFLHSDIGERAQVRSCFYLPKQVNR